MADEQRPASQPVESAEPRQPWDRRKDESKRAWTAFQSFRDSADRKLTSVAKSLSPPCSVANISRWSARHSWQARAAEFDSHQDQEHLAEIRRSRLEMRRRRLAISHALEGLGAHALKEWQDRIRMGLTLNLSLETIALLSKTAAQLQDQALGPERESRFTKINVILGDAPPIDEPATITRPAALSDDTTGEGFVKGDKERKPN